MGNYYSDDHNKKTKNLHQELSKFIKNYRPGGFDDDIADVIQYIRHVLKKHEYCNGGCILATQFNQIELKQKPCPKKRSPKSK